MLLQAEQFMDERPDNALLLLEDSIDAKRLSGKDYADWCLLLTQARDKNYIEHTSDSLIRVALDYYEGRNDPDRLMLTYYYMGRVSQDLNDAPRAQDFYLKALATGKTSSDLRLKAKICSNLGMLYTYQDDYDTALDYMTHGLEYLRQMGDTASQSIILTDIGRTYWTKKQFDSAVYYYQTALEYATPNLRSVILSELGGVYADNKVYDTALSYIRESLSIGTGSVNPYASYLTLGKAYLYTGLLDSAQFYLTKSLESPVLYTKAGSSYHLYQLSKQRKDWDTFVSMQEQYETLRDSIQQQTHTSTIQRMQSLYNYQQIKNEAEQHRLNLEISQQQNYFLFLGVMFLFVCLIGYYFYMKVYVRIRKEQWAVQESRLHQIIKTQKRGSEEQIAANIERMSELDSEIVDALDTQKSLIRQKKELLRLENQRIKQYKKVRVLREELLKSSPIYIKFHTSQSYVPKAQEKEELMSVVDSTYPNFIDTIIQLYPCIIEPEIEVCYYTKIGLRNIQISNRMCCEESTITMKKKRLYKKIHSKEGTAEELNRFIDSL